VIFLSFFTTNCKKATDNMMNFYKEMTNLSSDDLELDKDLINGCVVFSQMYQEERIGMGFSIIKKEKP
jgi:hypothetical protein